MNRSQLVKALAESATHPLADGDSESVTAAPGTSPVASRREIFVWFEDTSTRPIEGRRGIAGLPESLLPHLGATRVRERRYSEGHMHLLAAARMECGDEPSELFAALYTAALSVGTVAWIGTGAKYARTWNDMYGLTTRAGHKAPL